MMRQLAYVSGLALALSVPVAAQDAKLVETGRELYAVKECDRCHMVGGRGNKSSKLDGVGSKVSVDEIRRWLTAPAEMEAKLDQKPKVRMSSRKKMTLTDAEVQALVAYIRTLR